MKPEQEPEISAHAQQRREALKFLWHLCPPYLEKYDHTHWWKSVAKDAQGATCPEDAAMWEVLRRHPQAEKLLSHDQSQNSNLLEFEAHIQRFGHLSWPEAIQSHIKFEKYWGKSLVALPPQWGVVKQGMFDVDLIQDHELKKLGRKFNESLQRYQSPEKIDRGVIRKAYQIWNATRQTDSMKIPMLNSSAGAFSVLFGGGVLIGFDPTKPGIVEMVEKTVRRIVNEANHAESGESIARKSYWEAWLFVIAQFEDSEIPRLLSHLPPRQIPIRDDWLFARYRRIFENRPWPS
jgi:hypothetical protein